MPPTLAYHKKGTGVLSTILESYDCDLPKILEEKMINIKKIEILKENNTSWNESQTERIHDASGTTPTLVTHTDGQHEMKIFEKKCVHGGYSRNSVVEGLIVSSRGRDPTNPKSRLSGVPTKRLAAAFYQTML